MQRGQTIIEAVVALMTIMIILTAIAIVIVNGLYNSRFIKNQNEANKYSQQGMEFVRNIQKNNIEQFAGLVGAALAADPGFTTYCISGSTLTTDNCSPTVVNTADVYIRTIAFSPGIDKCDDRSEILTTVTVKWSSSKCSSNNTFCHKSELVSCLPYIFPANNP